MRFSLLFCFCLIALVVSNSCDTSPFKDAGRYNLYSLSSIYGCNSDVEGRVCANGPIFYENYSVGLLNLVNDGYSLVSSSVIDFVSGTVWHGGVIGESVSDIENVNIMIDGSHRNAEDCCPDSECDVCTSTAENSLPMDLDATSTYLLELSLYWLDLPSTEGATVEYLYQSLTLTCSDDEFNHFTGVHLDGVTSLTISCPASSTVLIDYTIDTVAVENMGIDFVGGITASTVIHHFCGPTLTISGVNIPGVVFAPWSDVFFPQGLITGQTFTGAFIGSDNTVSSVSAAYNDECGKYGDGHAIVTGPTGSMVFDAEPEAVFVQSSDGTATITGTARNGDMVFDVQVLLSDYSSSPPTNSPKKELKSECYTSNGGNVDTSTWEYYQTIEGTLTGVVGSTYEGAVITISRMGPSAQSGNGANGKNTGNGLSFWFNFEVSVQSTVTDFPLSGFGDFNLDSEVISNTECPNGQINRNPFDGCVPTMSDSFVCCQYENNGIINNFCSEDSCVTIEGWTLLSSYSTENCDECVCPQ